MASHNMPTATPFEPIGDSVTLLLKQSARQDYRINELEAENAALREQLSVISLIPQSGHPSNRQA